MFRYKSGCAVDSVVLLNQHEMKQINHSHNITGPDIDKNAKQYFSQAPVLMIPY